MINERFIELLTKKLSDEINESEADELKYILVNDEECRNQYNIFKTYWAEDQEQHSDNDLMFRRIKSKIGVVDGDEPAAEKSFKKTPWLWRGIAAALLAGVCFGAYFYSNYYQFATQPGPVAKLEVAKTSSRVKSKITLSDGTVITLNSETTLRYPPVFNGQTREVYLNGEAFFDVFKDHKHPFIVHAGKMNVKVLGTAFNIKSYANDTRTETTLIRGAIEVTMADRPSDRIILKPNEKLILNKTKNTVIAKRGPDNNLITKHTDTVYTNYALTNLTHLKSNDTTVVETSWVNNKLIFKDQAFNEIANQMERWYGVKIKFRNESVKDYRFTGVFENENVLQALDALKLIESFNYKYKDETVYIY
ncbi:FecR family protein [Mucilaginibacter sp.]|uniref:FecR family protein n=1 Tax=Mucilaginibacter sp. TaxID=1882438 RepID=UPI00284DBE55|nr:FecR family protein [Mucilaginibacter sp.]MDR3695921.1 FecR family protein [Mucilaginibacter sp.]